MRIVEHGVIHSGKPGTDGAIATFPSVTVLPDASLSLFIVSALQGFRRFRDAAPAFYGWGSDLE